MFYIGIFGSSGVRRAYDIRSARSARVPYRSAALANHAGSRNLLRTKLQLIVSVILIFVIKAKYYSIYKRFFGRRTLQIQTIVVREQHGRHQCAQADFSRRMSARQGLAGPSQLGLPSFGLRFLSGTTFFGRKIRDGPIHFFIREVCNCTISI